MPNNRQKPELLMQISLRLGNERMLTVQRKSYPSTSLHPLSSLTNAGASSGEHTAMPARYTFSTTSSNRSDDDEASTRDPASDVQDHESSALPLVPLILEQRIGVSSTRDIQRTQHKPRLSYWRPDAQHSQFAAAASLVTTRRVASVRAGKRKAKKFS